MADWEYDSTKKGLLTVFFDYEVEALNYLWDRNGEYASSREVYEHVRKGMQISRASIINSLNRMVKKGVLKYDEKTGKGGHRGLYSPAMNEAEMRKRIAEELIQSIKENLT
jgi:predicted transcriptional regulator